MRYLSICLLSVMLLCNGCGLFFQKRITNDNLRSSTEARGIAERAATSQISAERIETEAKAGKKSVLKDLRVGSMSEHSAEDNLARYIRIEEDANLIQELARLNEKSSEQIVRINLGTWYTTGWFKIISACVICFILLFLISYITYLMKSWGLLSYVKNINEGIADGVADMINVNKDIDNDDVNDEINRRIRKNKKR